MWRNLVSTSLVTCGTFEGKFLPQYTPLREDYSLNEIFEGQPVQGSKTERHLFSACSYAVVRTKSELVV